MGMTGDVSVPRGRGPERPAAALGSSKRQTSALSGCSPFLIVQISTGFSERLPGDRGQAGTGGAAC